MQKLSFLCLFLTNALNIYSQSNLSQVKDSITSDQSRANYISYYLTTDILSAMNSFLSPDGIKVTITGEACLNHEWGFLFNTGYQKENTGHYKRSGIYISPEIRWYNLNEDCSAPHLGAYLSFEDGSILIDEHSPGIPNLNFKELIFEAGFSAGYKLLLIDHWVINPTASIGFSNHYKKKILDGENTDYYLKESGMEIRIALLAGYRF